MTTRSTQALTLAGVTAGAIIVLGQVDVEAFLSTGAGPADVPHPGATAVHVEATGGPIGPDVIVGALPDTTRWATDATETAYSIATTSCNIGDTDLLWVQQPSNMHPVIGQNMFRMANGRFEQIGQSWLKHAFCALQLDLAGCGNCPNAGGCLQHLEPGCADPYTADRNGSQGGLGPKWQVDANTGVFSVPWDQGEGTSGSFRRRIRVQNTDLGNPGALYFIEGQYVTQDDAASGNQDNNASYRRVTMDGAFNLSLSGPTQMMSPGIQAWQDNDASVTLKNMFVQSEGLFILGYKVTDNGNGTWDYEYAVQNLNSDRSGRSFSIPVGDGSSLSSVGFHDVAYHSGDGISGSNYDGTDWSWTISGGDLTWSTQTYAENQNANALRWGTLYNFRFTSTAPPVAATATLGLFKPGSPNSVSTAVEGPDITVAQIAISFPSGVPAMVDPAGSTVQVQIEELEPGGLVGGSEMIFVNTGSGFVGSALTPLGGDLYEGAIGASTCGTEVQFYAQAEDSNGVIVTNPGGAPSAAYVALSGLSTGVAFDDDGETDPGWTVINDPALLDGGWDRGVPAGGGDRGDPIADADGSGQCWLTDNVDGNSDVDGGPTELISPDIDLSSAGAATITYSRWFTCDDAGTADEDFMTVYLSDDGGSTWTLVDTAADGTSWVVNSVNVGDHVALTSTVRIRFVAIDEPNNSVVEAGVDAVKVSTIVCDDGGEPCPADLDGSGDVAFPDLLAVLAAWGPCPGCPEDLDGSNAVDFPDLLAVLAAWGNCP